MSSYLIYSNLDTRIDLLRNLHQPIAYQNSKEAKMNAVSAKTCHRFTRGISIAFLFLVLAGCAGGSNGQNELVFHSFQFDVSRDSPNAELIDYRYGNSQNVGVANYESQRQGGYESPKGRCNW